MTRSAKLVLAIALTLIVVAALMVLALMPGDSQSVVESGIGRLPVLELRA